MVGESPYCVLKMLCNLCALVRALAAVVLMCCRNVRLWSNVTQRNLPCLVVGIVFL